jgi:hypothetical protein
VRAGAGRARFALRSSPRWLPDGEADVERIPFELLDQRCSLVRLLRKNDRVEPKLTEDSRNALAHAFVATVDDEDGLAKEHRLHLRSGNRFNLVRCLDIFERIDKRDEPVYCLRDHVTLVRERVWSSL